MHLNKQKPENVDRTDSLALDVVTIWPTIQGEGPYTGMPATFVRLAGCNLMCPMCDTDYTSGRRKMDVLKIVEEVLSHKNRLVVITGGEPFRQDICDICSLLCDRGLLVQIETNGAIDPPRRFADVKEKLNSVFCQLCVVCSPKTAHLSPAMAGLADAWKYVIQADCIAPDGLPTSALGMRVPPGRPTNKGQVYVQPADQKDDELNRKNTEAEENNVRNTRAKTKKKALPSTAR